MDNVLVSFSKIIRCIIFFFFFEWFNFDHVFRLRHTRWRERLSGFFLWDCYLRTCDGKSHKMSRLFHFVVEESNLIPSLLMPYHHPCPTYRERAIHVAVVWIICFLRFISHLDSKKITARYISTDSRRYAKLESQILNASNNRHLSSLPRFLRERWFNHDYLVDLD